MNTFFQVGYDDVAMIRYKSEYIRKLGLGGGMVWALDLDDFKNRCGQGHHPLMNTIKEVLGPKITAEEQEARTKSEPPLSAELFMGLSAGDAHAWAYTQSGVLSCWGEDALWLTDRPPELTQRRPSDAFSIDLHPEDQALLVDARQGAIRRAWLDALIDDQAPLRAAGRQVV